MNRGTFELLINLGNAAFEPEPGPETARLLRLAADRIEDGREGGPLLDCNGNRVGSYGFVPVPEPEPIAQARDLPEGLAYVGIRGTVDAGTEADRPDGFDDRSKGWTATVTGPDGTGIVVPYWTGPAITDAPTLADVVHSVLLDASYVSEVWGGPEGLTRVQVETIEARDRWFRSVLGDRIVDRLTELAADY